jgi:hypothetical protein
VGKDSFLVFGICCAFLYSSCATILTSRKQNIKIESVPSNADVFLEGELKGKSPCTVRVPKRREGYEPELYIMKEGFKRKKVPLESTSNPIILLNVLNLGLGYPIDLATNKWFYYKKDFYSVELEKSTE